MTTTSELVFDPGILRTTVSIRLGDSLVTFCTMWTARYLWLRLLRVIPDGEAKFVEFIPLGGLLYLSQNKSDYLLGFAALPRWLRITRSPYF